MTGNQSGILPLLAARNISKRFGVVQALDDVTAEFHAGTIHALVGANGAGKSTLLNILSGIVTPDSGSVALDGEEILLRNPSGAARWGLTFIHQELNLVPKFSVIKNMALGQVDATYGFSRWRSARLRAREILDRLGVSLPLDLEVDRLSVNGRWMVSLGRALMRDARLIAMDEPTASFTDAEVQRLFEIVRDLKKDGVAIIYVSHRLEEVLELSDCVTVFRDGRLVGNFEAKGLDRRQLTEHIVGRAVADFAKRGSTAGGGQRPPVLRAEGLVREPAVRGVSLEVDAGEILGIAGLVGSGRTETAQLLFGLMRPSAGTMTLEGVSYAPASSHEAIRRGVAFVPEERRSQGLVLLESVAFNINMASLEQHRIRKPLPLLNSTKARAAAEAIVSRLGIKTLSVHTRVSHLSGGNQQKVVLGKCVAVGPRLLILDEPTVGVDVGARTDIYRHIVALAEAGTAVILISSDFDELTVCDRVAVMRDGRITGVVDGADVSREHLIHLCYDQEAAA